MNQVTDRPFCAFMVAGRSSDFDGIGPPNVRPSLALRIIMKREDTSNHGTTRTDWWKRDIGKLVLQLAVRNIVQIIIANAENLGVVHGRGCKS